MKVVLINTVYPSGSTGKIVQVLNDYYKLCGHETVVIYGQGQESGGTYHKVASWPYIKLQALRCRITGIMYGGCFLSTAKAIRIVRKEKPDVVHLHCLNSNFINIFMLVSWLKKHKINTVVTNHAEFLYTGNCGYALDCTKYQTGCGNCPRLRKETKSWFRDGTHRSWMKMKRSFENFNTSIVANVSPWSYSRSSESKILGDLENTTVMNGVDTSVFTYRKRTSSEPEKIIFHATSHFSDDPKDIKGGKYLIELAKRFEGQNVKFLVAGKCEGSISVPPNMILLGHISDQTQLARLYSDADLVVLTSKKETYSMITAESLCCGTPVVGFRAGGPEQIAIPEYSEFVEYGDMDALYAAVMRFLDSGFKKDEISEAARKKYSNEKMADDYLKVYEKCIKRKGI